MNIVEENGDIEIKSVRRHRFKPNSSAVEDVELLSTAAPIHSLNSTEFADNLNNMTIGNGTNTNNSAYNESDMFWTVLGPLFLVLLCTCSHRSNVPSSQYHRGAMIRRQAERVWEIQRAKTERQAIPTEKRMSQISKSLRKMKVVSKCPKTGHCILGAVEEVEERGTGDDIGGEKKTEATQGEKSVSTEGEGPENTAEASLVSSRESENIGNLSSTVHGDENVSSPLSSTDNNASQSGMNCPESPGRTERRPLLSPDSEDSDDYGTEEIKQSPQTSSNKGDTSGKSYYDDFEDDEDVCPICLDNFEVGDVVMWSRFNSCSHVFHEECLMQWLLEQRENECPTCRACFITEAGTDSTASSSSSTADANDSSDFEQEDNNDNSLGGEILDGGQILDDGNSGDIEEGNATNIISNDAPDDDTNSNDCPDDSNEPEDQNHKLTDTNEENDSSKSDIIDDAEEGFVYIIVKGSAQRMQL